MWQFSWHTYQVLMQKLHTKYNSHNFFFLINITPIIQSSVSMNFILIILGGMTEYLNQYEEQSTWRFCKM